MNYRVINLKELRRQFQKIINSTTDPLLICPNHLTYIDSIILIVIFGSCWDYLKDYRTFPWNFPKTTHVRKNFIYKFLGYLSKCIFIELEDPNTSEMIPLELMHYVLSKGDYVMLFPEGHRSTNGRVDTQNFAYGVGRLVKDNPHVKVVCVYLRGKQQQFSSNYPIRSDQFYCSLEILDLNSLGLLNQEPARADLRSVIANNSSSGWRLSRKIAKAIIDQIALMEQNYYSL